jgi:hypothetical protein
LTGFTGFLAWDHDPSANLSSGLLGAFNPVNPLNPVNPVECMCAYSDDRLEIRVSQVGHVAVAGIGRGFLDRINRIFRIYRI